MVKKMVFLEPLALRALAVLLAALGGWLAGEYPQQVAAFCTGA